VLHHFSADQHPTLYHALPALEDLQSAWEDKLEDSRYELYHDALKDGLAKIKKYYCKFDEKPAYIISLGKCSVVSLYSISICLFSASPVLQAGLHQNCVGRIGGSSSRTCRGKPWRQELARGSVEGHRGCGELTYSYCIVLPFEIETRCVKRWRNTGIIAQNPHKPLPLPHHLQSIPVNELLSGTILTSTGSHSFQKELMRKGKWSCADI